MKLSSDFQLVRGRVEPAAIDPPAEGDDSEASLVRELGTRLRTARESKGLSRAAVARSAGMTRSELAAFERGEVRPDAAEVRSLAGSCGIDVEELVAGVSPLVDFARQTSIDVKLRKFLGGDDDSVTVSIAKLRTAHGTKIEGLHITGSSAEVAGRLLSVLMGPVPLAE